MQFRVPPGRGAATASLVFVAAFIACSAPTPLDPCDALRGAHFRSRQQFAAGLGPDGVELGHQFIRFSADGQRYEWTREDMTSSGNCSCSGGVVRASGSPTSDKPFAGRYDPSSGVLIWEGLEFLRVP